MLEDWDANAEVHGLQANEPFGLFRPLASAIILQIGGGPSTPCPVCSRVPQAHSTWSVLGWGSGRVTRTAGSAM